MVGTPELSMYFALRLPPSNDLDLYRFIFLEQQVEDIRRISTESTIKVLEVFDMFVLLVDMVGTVETWCC